MHYSDIYHFYLVEIDIKQSAENVKGVLFPLLLKELLVYGVGLQCFVLLTLNDIRFI